MAYHRDQSDYDRYDKQDKQFKKDDARMKYGRNFKDFMKDKEPSLRRGEVKRYDKRLGKYVSNKD